MNTSNGQTHVVGRSVGRGNPAPIMLTFGKLETWTSEALCADHPDYEPDAWFEEEMQEEVMQVCRACPVRVECLTIKLENEDYWGVWGGVAPGRKEKTYRNVLGKLKRERKEMEENRGTGS